MNIGIFDIVNPNLSIVIVCPDENVFSNMILDQITLFDCTYVILLEWFFIIRNINVPYFDFFF